MKEFFTNRNIRLGVALAAGITALGLASPEATAADPKKHAPSKSEITVSTQYYSDGTRMLRYHGTATTENGAGYDFPSDVFEFCDGPDLVEQTLGTQNFPAGSMNRISNYHGCVDDGKLTKRDFVLPKHN